MIEWEWYTDIPVKVLFLHLLLKANHEDANWRGNEIRRGQTITSIQNLADETGLSVQNVRTGLRKLQLTGEITCKPTSKFTLITVENYTKYQACTNDANTQINTQPNKRLTNNQQTTNNKQEEKEYKKNKNLNIVRNVIEHLNYVTGKKYSYKTDSYIKLINARLSEGYTESDLIKVIDNKNAEWKGSKYEQYLRPQTLFSKGHFDDYLNSTPRKTTGNPFLDILENLA